jgi:broad specificity phosphatase PhoE
VGIFALLGACTPPAAAPAPVAARTVYLVRHAEKGTEPANDPPLTAAGQARAQALAVALADAGVRSVLTTQLLRTRETARPLAEKLGLQGQVVGVSGAAKAHAEAVAAAVKSQPAGAVLVVGHSNTVPLIIEALGGPAMPMICDSQYANLYVVQLWADGKVTLARTEYGARSPDDPQCTKMAPR